MAKPAYDIIKLECDPYDKRVTARHINDGRINHEELQKHLTKLPDDASKAETIEVVIGEDSAGE